MSSYVSDRITAETGIQTCLLADDRSTVAKLPGGTTVPIVEETILPICFHPQLLTKLCARVYPNLEYDVIFGKDWLDQYNPKIDWKKGILQICVKTELLNLTVERSAPATTPVNCIALPRRDLIKSLKHGDELFLGNIAECSLQSPNVTDDTIVHLLSEFTDVFPPEFSSLPPVRNIEHLIGPVMPPP